MDNKLCKLSTTLITVSAMPDQELDQVTELLDRKVGSQTGLSTLLTNNTNTDIGSLNHGYIVATIANTAHALLGVLADELSNLGFLVWRATASNNSRQLNGDRDEFEAEVREKEGQTVAIHEETSIRLASEEVKMLLSIVLLRKFLAANDKRAQSFACHVSSFFIKPIARVLNTGILMEVDNDTHAFAFGSERENIENPHANHRSLAVGVLQYHALAITVHQFQTNGFSPFDDSNLVR
ncbi:unnamed protein product [Fusarium graminearum]|nr:unnamed protein product [Fusarium graminearum]